MVVGQHLKTIITLNGREVPRMLSVHLSIGKEEEDEEVVVVVADGDPPAIKSDSQNVPFSSHLYPFCIIHSWPCISICITLLYETAITLLSLRYEEAICCGRLIKHEND